MNQEYKLSIELEILILSIQVVIYDKSEILLLSKLENSKIDWNRVLKLGIYHQIRPILYEAFRKLKYYPPIYETLKLFSRSQAIKSLVDKQELLKIDKLFVENNIRHSLYKGLLFKEALYENNNFRESADVDIIVRPQEASHAMRLLLENGFIIDTLEDMNKLSLVEIIEKVQHREITFIKKLKGGVLFTLDFHWGIRETYHEYTMDVDRWIGELDGITSEFKKERVIFEMLLNHHGQRNCWLRLKDICDFIAFKQAFSEIPTEMIYIWAKELMMEGPLFYAEQLSLKLFKDKYLAISTNKTIVKIINFWENAEYFDKIIPKYQYFSIYRSMQTPALSWLKLINNQIRFYGVPHLYENARIYSFRDKYRLLNVLSKLISYIWYKYILRKKGIWYNKK